MWGDSLEGVLTTSMKFFLPQLPPNLLLLLGTTSMKLYSSNNTTYGSDSLQLALSILSVVLDSGPNAR